jgi:DNA-binding NarL/FixJ family response regulator
MNPVRVFLIDDEELLIESMEIILTLKGKMQVVGMAREGKEALEKLTTTPVDIALVDLNMKGMGGIELIPILKRDYPKMKILVLTTFYDDHYITNAISNGADGYMLKDSEDNNIIRAIHQILTGQSIIDSKVMKILSKKIASSQSENTQRMKKEHSLPKDFTPRELELCVYIAQGDTNKEIAEKFIHIRRYRKKLYVLDI